MWAYEHTNGARAAILLKPTDQLEHHLERDLSEQRNSVSINSSPITSRRSSSTRLSPSRSKDEYRLGALKINYDFGSAKLTSVTSYYDRRRFFLNDIDYFTGLLGVATRVFAAHLHREDGEPGVSSRLDGDGSPRWLVGAYFEDDHEQALQSVSPAGAPVPPPAEQLVDINRITNNRQYALFGEANYQITPQLTATAGVRVSRIRGDNTSINDGLLFGGESIKTGNHDNNPVTPRVILSYMPTRDWQIYAQASKGFRIGA